MQHNEQRLYDTLVNMEPELESTSLVSLEVVLKAEITKQHIDLLNVARVIERIEWGLYEKLPGCRNADQYFSHLSSRIDVPKQTVSRWRKIAAAYNRHVIDFEAYGVRPTEVVSQLAYLERALKNHPGKKAEVFGHRANDTVKKFIKYA